MKEINLFSQSTNVFNPPKYTRDKIRTVRKPNNKYAVGGAAVGSLKDGPMPQITPETVTPKFEPPTHLDPIKTTSTPESNAGGGITSGEIEGIVSTAGNMLAEGLNNLRQEQETQRAQEGQKLLAKHKQEVEGFETSQANMMKANAERKALGEEQRAQMLKTQQSALQPPTLNANSALTPAGFTPTKMALGGPGYFRGPKNKQFIGAAVQTALAVDKAAGSLLAGNKKSGVGSAISALPGGGILGGAISAAFGQSEDTALHAKVDEDTNYLNTFQSNANTFDDVQGPRAVNFNTDVYEDGWFGGDADEKNEELRQKLLAAEDKANRNVDNNVTNLQKQQRDNLQASFAAYGGPLSIFNFPIEQLKYRYSARPQYRNGEIISLNNKREYLKFLKEHPELELEAID